MRDVVSIYIKIYYPRVYVGECNLCTYKVIEFYTKRLTLIGIL